ncbi:MAG: DUF58 domain-containing protein [Gammaproteobacteria bacterium]|nr:DUF58 domain-containing protein [Gammaproteobacteria bacterium]
MIAALDRLIRVNQAGDEGHIQLAPSRIYILPTPFGLVFFILLVLLLVGSINYANNLGFLLTFFLAAVGFLSMIHTWRNLLGLQLLPCRVEPVFAGEEALFRLQLAATSPRFRGDIELIHPTKRLTATDYQPPAEGFLSLALPSRQRGYFQLGRCRLETRYPLGIFRAWSYIQTDLRCLVYPKPETWSLELNPGAEAADHQGLPRKHHSGQDFHGIRQYQPGDPPKSIHWQSLARGAELMSRDYESQSAEDLWLDLEQMPGADLETRLRQLCYAVLACAKQPNPFGLRLGPEEIAPDQGEQHLQRALQALALFGKG